MMKTVKGPGIFLAQFLDDRPPFDTLEHLCEWAASLGYKGVQLPAWDARIIDLERAAQSAAYCDEIRGKITDFGLEITELSTHLIGQLVAVHPAYDGLFDAFAPKEVHGNPKARTAWAIRQMKNAATASKHLGLTAHATFSGSLLWPYMYPWPQRANGLLETGFRELAGRWRPILDHFDDCGVDVCYEIHPGEDLFDGHSYERFLEEVDGHSRACLLYDPSHFLLQQLDYLEFIDIYHEKIKAFHVKDAEFNPSGKSGVYGGYRPWLQRAGRFRSPGDGQVDFASIFSKLAQYGYEGWAVMEWECCIKSSEQGAREGAPFIENHIIRVTERAFDDFASGEVDQANINKTLGL